MSAAHKRVLAAVSARWMALAKNLPGKGVFFEPPFRRKQLGSAADKFETVHVSAVSVDKWEPGRGSSVFQTIK